MHCENVSSGPGKTIEQNNQRPERNWLLQINRSTQWSIYEFAGVFYYYYYYLTESVAQAGENWSLTDLKCQSTEPKTSNEIPFTEAGVSPSLPHPLLITKSHRQPGILHEGRKNSGRKPKGQGWDIICWKTQGRQSLQCVLRQTNCLLEPKKIKSSEKCKRIKSFYNTSLKIQFSTKKH